MQRDERALRRERRWANRGPVGGSAAAQARRCGEPPNAPVLSRADHDQRGRRIPRRCRRGRARPGVRSQGEPARLAESRSRSARAANPKKMPARPGASGRQVTRRTCPSCREQITISAGGESQEDAGEAGRVLASGHKENLPVLSRADHDQRGRRIPRRSRRGRARPGVRSQGEPARLAESRSRSARAASRGKIRARPGAVWRQVTTENLPVLPRADHDQRGRPVLGKSRRGRAPPGVSARRTREVSSTGPPKQERTREVSSTEPPKQKNARAKVSSTETQNKNLPVLPRADHDQRGRPVLGTSRRGLARSGVRSQGRTCRSFREQITISAGGQSRENPGEAGRGLASGHKGEPARLAQSRSRSARAASPGKVPARPGAAWSQRTKDARGFKHRTPRARTHARGFKHRTPKTKKRTREGFKHRNPEQEPARLAQSRSRSARAASPGNVPARPGPVWRQVTTENLPVLPRSAERRVGKQGLSHRGTEQQPHERGFQPPMPETRAQARGFKIRTPKTKIRTREGFKHRNPEQEPARLSQSRSRSARAVSPGNVPARPGPVWRQVTTKNLPVFP